jgi:hypothetical protein
MNKAGWLTWEVRSKALPAKTDGMDRSPFETASVGHDGRLDHRQQNEEGPKMQVTTLGIDLAKNVFQLHGCDAKGRPVLRKQLTRKQMLAFLSNLPSCLVAMEACATAHYWRARLRSWVIRLFPRR